MEYINITLENLEQEHICCAIGDKKHRGGVDTKKVWMKERMKEGHVFRKLNAQGKVFIEYAPVETAWAPINGDHYLYIYCLWVAGSFKGKGHARDLLSYCIEDAKRQGKSGICVMSAKKKKPYMSDKKFFQQFGFEVVDQIGEYELLALCFDANASHFPQFTESARTMKINEKELSIYYSSQCPFIANCIVQISNYCDEQKIPLYLHEVDTLEKAKSVPCVFNNWATFLDTKYLSNLLLNENALKKLLDKERS